MINGKHFFYINEWELSQLDFRCKNKNEVIKGKSSVYT